MMKEIRNIEKCPLCEGELFVKEFRCRDCGSEIVGDFRRNKFCNLSPELLQFAEIFLLNEGNIKAVEETLGYSYPKIKSIIRELIKALGYEYRERKAEGRREEILNMLERGEINAQEAIDLLNKI